MIQRERIRFGDRSLNMAITGDGPPLLLLHGVTRRWQSFLPLLPHLALRWRVHALDQRGHGQSDAADGEYRVTDYVRDAARVLRERFDEPVVVYGHSLGAMVATALAAEVPEHVGAVIAEDPPFHTMGERYRETSWHEFFAGLLRIRTAGGDVATISASLAEMPVGHPDPVPLGTLRDATSLRFTARCLEQLDPAVLEGIVDGRWLDGYAMESLDDVRRPLLLMQADFDTGGMLVDDDAARLDCQPNVTHVRFPGRGHLLHWQATAEVVNHVVNFLESLDR